MPRRSPSTFLIPVALLLLAAAIGCRSKSSRHREIPACPAAHALSEQVLEPSGLVASRRHPGVFWTHGDSGCAPKLYAVAGDGTLLRTFDLNGGSCIDWEDIAVDDAGNLYIADTGNNTNDRRDLAIHRVPEPDTDGTEDVVRVDWTYRFRYADQKAFPDPKNLNFDAEAIFWADGLFLLSKHRGDRKTELFRIPEEAANDEVAISPIGEFYVGGERARYGGMVTAADVTPDGRFLAVLTYHALFVFERPSSGSNYLSRPLNRIDFNQDRMQQTESLAWDGWSLLIGNEDRELYRLSNPFAKRSTPFP